MSGLHCSSYVSDSEDDDVNAHAAEQFALQMQGCVFPISSQSPMLFGMVRDVLCERDSAAHKGLKVLAQVHVMCGGSRQGGITQWNFLCRIAFEHNDKRYNCDTALTPGAFFEACAWHRAAIAFVSTRSVTGFAVSRERNGKLWAMCADQIAQLFSWSPDVMTPNLPKCVRCHVQRSSSAAVIPDRCKIMFTHGRNVYGLKSAEDMSVWDVYALCSTYTEFPQSMACLYPALASATSYAFGVPKCYSKGLAQLREAPIGATWLGFVSLGQRAVAADNGARLVFADSSDAYSRERTSVYCGGFDFAQWAAIAQKAGTWRVYCPQPLPTTGVRAQISPQAFKIAVRRPQKRPNTRCLQCKNCKRKKKCLFPTKTTAAATCHGPMCSATDNVRACEADPNILHCSRCAKSCSECVAMHSKHDRVQCAFYSPCTMRLERGKTWCKVLAPHIHKRVVLLQDMSIVQFDATQAFVGFDDPVLYAQFGGQRAEKVPLNSNLHEWLRQPCPGSGTETRGEILRRGNVHLATLEQQLPHCDCKHGSKALWRTVTTVTPPPLNADRLSMDAMHVALKHCAYGSTNDIIRTLATSSCLCVPKIDAPCKPFALQNNTGYIRPLVVMLDILQYRSRRLLEVGGLNFSANLRTRVAYTCHAYPGDNDPYDIILWPSSSVKQANGQLLTQFVCSNWHRVQNAILITATNLGSSVLKHVDSNLQQHFIPLFNVSNWQCLLLVGQ